MIAQAVVATGLPPSAFGVESSPELGGLILEVLQEQGRAAHEQDLLNRLRRR
jgi:hypothetical protein